MRGLTFYTLSVAITTLCLLLILGVNLPAQNSDVCQEGDCSPTLQSVQLAPPIKTKIAPGSNPQRTEQYKAAYLQVKQIKQSHLTESGWLQKYNANQLSGQSCLRLNQLEGYFVHEYAQNPDFAKFVDQQEMELAAWKENGFQASRRAINLHKRMENKCPQQTRKLERGNGPSLADLPQTYQKLGQVQGYFDEQGKLLKPLDAPVAPNAAKKLEELTGAIGGQLSNLLPQTSGLLTDIKAAKDLLGSLKNFKPVIPGGGLLSKIGNLFNFGGDLQNKAQDLANKGKQFKDCYDQLTQAVQQPKGEQDQQVKNAEELKEALAKLEDGVKALAKQQKELSRETEAVQQEVEQAKKQEGILGDLVRKLEDLKSEEARQEELAQCESALKKLLNKINGVDEVQEKIKKKSKGLFTLPGKLLGKLSDLKLFQNKLKLGKNGIPLVGKALAKVDQLIGTANTIGSTVETLTGKKSQLQEKIENIDQKIQEAKGIYEGRETIVNGYKDQLIQLIGEKSGLKDKLDQGISDAAGMEAQVQDFIRRYNIFDENSNCLQQEELQGKIADLEKEQAETEPELEELAKELEEAEEKTEELEAETKATEEMIEALEEEKAAIKEEFGTDVELEPVTMEEWSESFQVERPYWDAVFHPDDEVVDGYKGRYFEVRLKDAEKTIKLLFGPGEYYMDKSTFRKTYGTTIGTFATEALQAMKKADRNQVELFIQGSADLAGHTTFSGNLDERYRYDEVEVLPQKSDPENFSNTPTAKPIPERNFRNDHLPDLRGRYLKEMISVYSKKFDPIILEGAVKQFQDEEERNAIIYLFFPEELLSTYEKK